MNLLRFLLKHCRGMVLFAGVTALFSGACISGLLALVNVAVNEPKGTTSTLVLGFAALASGGIVTGCISQLLTVRFSQRAIADIRRELVRRIVGVPLQQLAEIGAPRLRVALTDDVKTVTAALFGFPALANNIAVLFGGSVYLGLLSWRVLIAMGLFVALGTLCYGLLIMTGFRSLHRACEAEDRLFNHFRALIEGIKELKQHRERRGAFLNRGIQSTTADFQRKYAAAETRFILAHNFGHLLYLLLISLILFLLPFWEHLSTQATTGCVITSLYLFGPFAGVLGGMALFNRANVALEKIEDLGLSLVHRSSDTYTVDRQIEPFDWQRLDLNRVTHSYHREKEGGNFVLGPINLTVHRGELVFLAGDIGSGKSTLGRIITGLYTPETGEIRLDGKPITDQNRDDYRQLYSALFSDYYLFDGLTGLSNPRLEAQALDYLVQLQLDQKVKIDDGALSASSLSPRQRKRLALLTAYLEDRSIYLFDDWASDQEPLFKEFFYAKLLPELKARGKTIVVITNDDKYFHLSDRMIKLVYGRIEQRHADRSKVVSSRFRPLTIV